MRTVRSIHTVAPLRSSSSARAISMYPRSRVGMTTSAMEVDGTRTSSRMRLPSGFRNAWTTTSLGMSWADTTAVAASATAATTQLPTPNFQLPTPNRPDTPILSWELVRETRWELGVDMRQYAIA